MPGRALVLALLLSSPALAQTMPADYQAVLTTLGRTGDFKDAVLKVNIPRADLRVTIRQRPAPTPFGFGGWVAFKPAHGGAMVMGGLLQDNIRQTISGFPGLLKLPVLGTLFRSRDFKRNETELVIIVTPYLVKPVARTALAKPDDGFNPASDATSDFLGRINRVYGAKGKPAPAGSYSGKYGFIYE